MGIPWFTEICLSSFRSGQMAWNIFDVINASQGIFIFIVFVMKKRVYNSIRKRFRGGELTWGSTVTKSFSLSSGSRKSFTKNRKTNKQTSETENE